MIDIQVLDGRGTGNKLKINGEGELTASLHTHPPIDEDVELYPFSQYFTDDGSSTGDSDMRVDGSSTNADFFISAKGDRDIWIKVISVRISDAAAVLNKFGNLAALTNGVEFCYVNNVLGTVTIQNQIKTNLDFLRLGVSSAAIGGTDAFKADLSGGGADTYLPVIDLSVTFGFPWGLRLKKGSKDQIKFIVKDNLATGAPDMDQFDIIGFGTQI